MLITPSPTNSSNERLSWPEIGTYQPQAEGYALAEGEELLKHKHLEEDDRIIPLLAGIALACMSVSLLQQWPEDTPGYSLGRGC